MEIAGYIASILIGISLGLIGGGGSTLTVPVLVFLFGINPVLSTAYSLFIVGSTSLVGVISKIKQGHVHFKTALIFGIPSILTVFITRKWIMPAVPEEIFIYSSFVLTKPVLIMVLFALLMLGAAYSMIRSSKKETEDVAVSNPYINYLSVVLDGSIVGLLTGFVGAGGGFLIIPALNLLCKLPIKQAVGTSLLIIASKSLIGFMGDVTGDVIIDWSLLLSVTGLAILGILIGNKYSKKISSKRIKKGFGWFVLAMGIYILGKELI